MGRVHNKRPSSFILPDLVSHCDYPLTYHVNGDEVAKQSVKWLDSSCPSLSPKKRRALYGLQAGELTAFCYNTADKERLRIVSDFMNYLFHLYVSHIRFQFTQLIPSVCRDNISDGMMTRETNTLASSVMNAFWHPEAFTPTEDCPEELNAAKLAREYVISSVIFYIIGVLIRSIV